jgi:GxxExxY protein
VSGWGWATKVVHLDLTPDYTSGRPDWPTTKLDLAPELPDNAVGRTLGRCKLLERGGEGGGCAVVDAVESIESMRRRVAHKIIKLELMYVAAVNQGVVKIESKDLMFDEALRFDAVVDEYLRLELGCVKHVLPNQKAQLRSYMKLIDIPIGLAMHFIELELADRISRMILPGAKH